ncbi:MAG TPA: hypothetical protein VGM32_23700 [Rhodopila sp.]|jgi:hypothetical protein
MSTISSIAASAPVPRQTSAPSGGPTTSTTLFVDQKALNEANVALTAADGKATAAANAIRNDQQSVKLATAAAQVADAKLQADEHSSSGLNITA